MTANDTTITGLPPAEMTKTDCAAPPARTSTKVTTPTKSATVIKLLLRAKGATPAELIAATDWQPHSLRAFLSGLRKKGRVVTREPRKNGEAAYRIIAVATDTASEGDTAAESGATAVAAAGADTGATLGRASDATKA